MVREQQNSLHQSTPRTALDRAAVAYARIGGSLVVFLGIRYLVRHWQAELSLLELIGSYVALSVVAVGLGAIILAKPLMGIKPQANK